MTTEYLLGFVSSLIVAVSQLLLKLGALRYENRGFIRSYLNVFVMSGYALFLLVTVVAIYIYATLPLSMSSMFTGITYLAVLVLDRFLLKQRLDWRAWLGASCILLGIAAFIAL